MPNTSAEDQIDLDRIASFMSDSEKRTLEEMDPVNIVITGSTGIGKSTLINAVFGKKLAKVGVGAPITMQIEKITDPSLPMCLYDTRGLEIKNSAATISEIKNFIEDLRKATNAADQIHVVWLCIHERSNRWEPVHLDMLRLFQSYDIPCIVVLTQAQGNEEFLEKIQAALSPVEAVVPVMAAELKTKVGVFPVENLDVLVNETLRLLPDSRKKAFDYCQKADWDRKLRSAKAAVNWAVGAAAAAAPIPIPGGHAIALIAIETALLLRINFALGVSMEETEGKTVILGMMGIVAATAGGKMAFAELIKIIPGVGTLTGILIGGAVAVTITKMLGALYIDVVADLVKKGEGLPKADILINLLKTAFEARKEYYRGVSKDL